ncbi:MAG: hypothetical protein ABIJ08_06885, partial [Nanoarchaeota archaeon]
NFLGSNLTAFVSYLGLVVGLIIMHASKEEQKQGKKYFVLVQRVCIMAICSLLFIYLEFSLLVFGIVLLMIVLLFIKKIVQSYFYYPLLGLVFYFSLNTPKLLLMVSVLIFIYGMATSSILIDFKKKNYLEIILRHVSFLIIILILNIVTMF